MTIPVHADDQLWSVDDVSTYLTVPAATLLRRTTRRRWPPAPAWPDRVLEKRFWPYTGGATAVRWSKFTRWG